VYLLDVLGQTILSMEAFLAILADVGVVFEMRFDVFDEILFPLRRVLTVRTVVRPFRLMSRLVMVQLAAMDKSSSAEFANKRLDIFVNGIHMVLERSVVCEHFQTVLALVDLALRVIAKRVAPMGVVVFKLNLALSAVILLAIGAAVTHQLVQRQFSVGIESHVTFGAFEWQTMRF